MRDATREDLGSIVEILAGGFDEDPMFRWMFGAIDFDSALREWLEMVVGVTLGKGPAHIDDEVGAAAVWTALGVPLAEPEEMAGVGAFVEEKLGERASDVMGALGSVGAHKPEEPPSLHLVYVAVRPENQGNGAGAAILAPVLDACDQRGEHAYLHATNPDTVGFYERLGFEALAHEQMPDGGPVVAPMWREPR